MIRIIIVVSGWVLRPIIVIVLQPLTSQLTVSCCDELALGLTYARGGTLDLLMTDVSDLVCVAHIEAIPRRSSYGSRVPEP